MINYKLPIKIVEALKDKEEDLKKLEELNRELREQEEHIKEISKICG